MMSLIEHNVAGYPLGGRGGYWHAIPAGQLPAVSARARCGAYVAPRKDDEGYIPWEREPMRPGGAARLDAATARGCSGGTLASPPTGAVRRK